ncbi:MAG: hypothetical protein DWQ02_14410 [Bacteroidetes bacterium]|nr:MAG: hypothetical protein DWQ02_14410 [Bacteroidota bacterium]
MKFGVFLLYDSNFWELMWSDNTIIARGIILLIVFLMFLVINVFRKHWKRYSDEEWGLEKVKRKLEQWKSELMEYEEDEDSDKLEGDEDLEVLHQASIPMLLEGIRPGLIIYDRLNTLQENKVTKSRINVAVLQNLAQLKENKQWTLNFPKYAMTLSMLLGMLGTFIGLTMMVGDISEELKSIGDLSARATNTSEFSDSFSGIRNTLGGVGTAFSTTLSGLFCTILASILNYFLNQRRASFFDKLEQFTVQDLLPHTFPNLEEKTMLETIEDQLEDTFLNLNQTIEQNNVSLGELNGLYQKFDNIEDTLRSVLTSGGTTEIQNVISELNTVNLNLKGMIQEYESKQLLADFKKLTNHHTQYVNRLNGILVESNWIPNTKLFLIAIAGLLLVISIFLGLQIFS